MFKEQLNKAIQQYNSGLYSQVITTLLTSDYTEKDYIVHYYLGLCYIKHSFIFYLLAFSFNLKLIG